MQQNKDVELSLSVTFAKNVLALCKQGCWLQPALCHDQAPVISSNKGYKGKVLNPHNFLDRKFVIGNFCESAKICKIMSKNGEERIHFFFSQIPKCFEQFYISETAKDNNIFFVAGWLT